VQFDKDVDAYVDGSLPPAARREIEQHAALCPPCSRLLRELQEAAAVVWLSVPQVEPPSALRTRVLAAAGAVVASPSPRAANWADLLRPRWRWTGAQAAAALSGLCLLGILALGGWVWQLNGEVERQAADNARLRDQIGRQRDALYVLMSPTLVERSLQGGDAAPHARGRVLLDPQRRQGMLVASDLPRLEPDRTYQVWLRGPDGVVSAGLLRIDDRGTGYAVLDPTIPLDRFETVGISLEPAGGSEQPTGPRMLLGSL
jgi:anti-sigma-K factor RskA